MKKYLAEKKKLAAENEKVQPTSQTLRRNKFCQWRKVWKYCRRDGISRGSGQGGCDATVFKTFQNRTFWYQSRVFNQIFSRRFYVWEPMGDRLDVVIEYTSDNVLNKFCSIFEDFSRFTWPISPRKSKLQIIRLMDFLQLLMHTPRLSRTITSIQIVSSTGYKVPEQLRFRYVQGSWGFTMASNEVNNTLRFWFSFFYCSYFSVMNNQNAMRLMIQPDRFVNR